MSTPGELDRYLAQVRPAGAVLVRSDRITLTVRWLSHATWTSDLQRYPQGKVWRVWCGRLLLILMLRANSKRQARL